LLFCSRRDDTARVPHHLDGCMARDGRSAWRFGGADQGRSEMRVGRRDPGGLVSFSKGSRMWTQGDLDRLNAAIATGAKSVQFGSGDNAHRTEFRTLDEMLAIRRLIVASVSGGVSTTSYVFHTRD
jgi:hypothetical protein